MSSYARLYLQYLMMSRYQHLMAECVAACLRSESFPTDWEAGSEEEYPQRKLLSQAILRPDSIAGVAPWRRLFCEFVTKEIGWAKVAPLRELRGYLALSLVHAVLQSEDDAGVEREVLAQAVDAIRGDMIYNIRDVGYVMLADVVVVLRGVRKPTRHEDLVQALECLVEVAARAQQIYGGFNRDPRRESAWTRVPPRSLAGKAGGNGGAPSGRSIVDDPAGHGRFGGDAPGRTWEWRMTDGRRGFDCERYVSSLASATPSVWRGLWEWTGGRARGLA